MNTGVTTSNPGPQSGRTAIGWHDGSTCYEHLVIENNGGNVGIGLIDPATTLHVNGDVAFGAGSELTISSGVIEVTHSYHAVEIPSGTSANLDTINGCNVAGQILVIRAADSAHDVVVKDGTGNLVLAGGNDFTLDHIEDTLVLFYDANNWIELSRSDNS